MIFDLLFVCRFLYIVLVFLPQFDLHLLVKLYQLRLVRFQLGKEAAQALVKLQFTRELRINSRMLARQKIHHHHHHHHHPRFYVHLQKLEQQTLQLKTVTKIPRIKMF